MSSLTGPSRSPAESTGMPELHSRPLPDASSPEENPEVSHSRIPFWLLEEQPARICFVVSLVAFSAAAASLVMTSLLSGWMEIAGMVAIGLFYLGLGLLEAGRRTPAA